MVKNLPGEKALIALWALRSPGDKNSTSSAEAEEKTIYYY
jgi:hypothetical protein